MNVTVGRGDLLNSTTSPLDLGLSRITIKALIRSPVPAAWQPAFCPAHWDITYWPDGCTERVSRMDRQTRGLWGRDVLTHLPEETAG